MRKQCTVLSLMLSFVIFIAVGCTKQGLVKNEEPFAGDNQKKAEPLKTETLKTEELKTEVSPVSKATVKESSALEPIANASEIKTVLDTIYFDFDSYLLSQEARNALVKHAEVLKKDSAVTVKIEGNCDERGSDEYNLALGEKRARSAMQYLMTMGVPEPRLSIISYGKEKPAAVGHDENSWAKNRRDEFVITKR